MLKTENEELLTKVDFFCYKTLKIAQYILQSLQKTPYTLEES